jgi:hypothetical protein
LPPSAGPRRRAPCWPPPPPKSTATRSQLRKAKQAKEAHERHERDSARISKQGGGAIDLWAELVEQRLMIDEGKADQVFKALSEKAPPRGPLGAELVRALAAKTPASDKTTLAALDAMKAKVEVTPKKRPEPDVSTLFRSLPDAETVKRIAPYKKKTTNIWTGGEDGFTVKPGESPPDWEAPTEGVVSVTFRGASSPAGVVEEMALLRAAELALEKGVKGFVILDRQDVEHTVSTTQYGAVLRTDPAGYSTELDVLFVDPANLPAKYRGAAWRVIDADAVFASLGPIYIRPEADKPEKAKKK